MASGYFSPFNCTLHDFKGFQLVIVSVSFCYLSMDCILKISSSACGAICFKLFQYWGGGGARLALDLEDIYSLFCGAGHILTMFIHSNRSNVQD